MKLSIESKKFLAELSAELENIGSHPVLLRNYDDLPDEIGNDLDVFVTRESLPMAVAVLLRLALKHGGIVAHVHQRDYFAAYWLKFGNEERFWHVDLYPGALSWHGHDYLESCRFLTMTRRIGEWNVPRRAHEAMITFLTSLLWGGFFNQKYASRICQLLDSEDERREFAACFLKAFGEQHHGLIEAILKNPINTDIFPGFARSLRSALRIRHFRRCFLSAAKSLTRHWLGELRCYLLNPPGISIELPDSLLSNSKMDSNEILATTGNFFGGILDLRYAEGKKANSFVRMIRAFRAKGVNFLVVRSGLSAVIDGESPQEDDNPIDFKIRVINHLSKRIFVP